MALLAALIVGCGATAYVVQPSAAPTLSVGRATAVLTHPRSPVRVSARMMSSADDDGGDGDMEAATAPTTARMIKHSSGNTRSLMDEMISRGPGQALLFHIDTYVPDSVPVASAHSLTHGCVLAPARKIPAV